MSASQEELLRRKALSVAAKYEDELREVEKALEQSMAELQAVRTTEEARLGQRLHRQQEQYQQQRAQLVHQFEAQIRELDRRTQSQADQARAECEARINAAAKALSGRLGGLERRASTAAPAEPSPANGSNRRNSQYARDPALPSHGLAPNAQPFVRQPHRKFVLDDSSDDEAASTSSSQQPNAATGYGKHGIEAHFARAVALSSSQTESSSSGDEQRDAWSPHKRDAASKRSASSRPGWSLKQRVPQAAPVGDTAPPGMNGIGSRGDYHHASRAAVRAPDVAWRAAAGSSMSPVLRRPIALTLSSSLLLSSDED